MRATPRRTRRCQPRSLPPRLIPLAQIFQIRNLRTPMSPTVTGSGKRILAAKHYLRRAESLPPEPVKLASKMNVIAGKNSADRFQAERSSARLNSADRDSLVKVATNAPNPRIAFNSPPGLHRVAQPTGSSSLDSNSGEAVPSEPPPIVASETDPSFLTTVLSVKASVPGLSVPVSMGVTGGQLLHRVVPAYPNQARKQRLEGTVVLAASIMENGSLGEIKVIQGAVIQGSPLLAQSAIEAAKDWRYQPFQLDGKPVKGETTITFAFKYPDLSH